MAVNATDLEVMREEVSRHWLQMCHAVWLIRESIECRTNGTLATGVWTAYMDSFAANARSLVDFLVKPKRYEDRDVRATDYLPPGKWFVDDELKERLNTLYEKASKILAHITTERLEPRYSGEWLLCEAVNDIRTALLVFKKMLAELDAKPFPYLCEHEHLLEVTDARKWPRYPGKIITNTVERPVEIYFGST